MREKSFVIWLLLIALLIMLVINPLARLLWASFQHPETGAFTLANYAAAYGRWRHVEALINSLVIGLAVAALCTVFGVPMAWAVSRTDMPGKGLVWAAVLGTFIMPNYLGAVAWILMAGPNAGWLNRVYTAITAADAGPFNVYSKTGLVLVIACYSFPYMFVFTRSALDLISSEMEDAASTLGAGALRTTLRVTLPLALPAIMGAFIVEFLESIALFGAPALIALPARFQVMTTTLWQMFEFPPRVQEAAAYAMPLLLITVFLFWLQYRIMARKGYVALTGKGGERRLVRLSPRFILLGYCLVVTSLRSSCRCCKAASRGPPRLLGQRHATTCASCCSTDRRRRHAEHSCGGGLRVALTPRLHRGAPPGPARPGADLRGDGSLRHPGHRARDRVLRRLHHEAPRALRHRVDPHPGLRDPLSPHRVHQQRRGAPQHQPGTGGRGPHPGRRPAPVPASNSSPLLKRGLAGAFILVFIPATRELSSAIFLYTTGTQVLSVLLFDKSDEGNFEVLSSMGLILVVATVALVLVGFRMVGRDFLLRRTATWLPGPPVSRLRDRDRGRLPSPSPASSLWPSGCGKTHLRMIAASQPSGGIDMDGGGSRARLHPAPSRRQHVDDSNAASTGAEGRAASRSAQPRRCRGHLGGRYPRSSGGQQRWRGPRDRGAPAAPRWTSRVSNLDANLREECATSGACRITHCPRPGGGDGVTSDRIAVMHQGRIEQVDAPRALYARPRTRFVAGFIGRTNLLGGLVRGEDVVFDHFTIARDRFAEAAALQGQVSFSLRPQSIHLYRQSPPASDRVCVIPGVVAQRAYLAAPTTVRPTRPGPAGHRAPARGLRAGREGLARAGPAADGVARARVTPPRC
jgi:ABC-type Fe3+ transport system permease subunit